MNYSFTLPVKYEFSMNFWCALHHVDLNKLCVPVAQVELEAKVSGL